MTAMRLYLNVRQARRLQSDNDIVCLEPELLPLCSALRMGATDV